MINFSKMPVLQKIAVCFNCQVLPELPEEETDVRPDRILTEEGWI